MTQKPWTEEHQRLAWARLFELHAEKIRAAPSTVPLKHLDVRASSAEQHVGTEDLYRHNLDRLSLDVARVDREVALVYAIATADNATRAMIAEERGAHERRIAKLASGRYQRVTGWRAVRVFGELGHFRNVEDDARDDAEEDGDPDDARIVRVTRLLARSLPHHIAIEPVIATIAEGDERAARWRETFGGLSVEVWSPQTEKCELGIGVRDVYYVAVERLAPDVIDRVVAFIERDFEVPADEVRRGLFHGEGLPIVAEGVTLTIGGRVVS